MIQKPKDIVEKMREWFFIALVGIVSVSTILLIIIKIIGKIF